MSALRLAPWSVRSARTAEEDDELPLHAALAAGAEHALVRRLLAVDPGGAFVKDAAGDLPLCVALRAAAAPATVEALLLLFPESSAKRGGDGLTQARSSPRTTRRRRRKRRWRRWCAARAPRCGATPRSSAGKRRRAIERVALEAAVAARSRRPRG